MNVVQSSRPAIKLQQQQDDTDSTPTSTIGVNFYHDLPSEELTLEEFEEFALARLKVLRKIEELKVRNVLGHAFRVALEATLKAQGFLGGGRHEDSQKLDVASHYILRAAYCRTEDLRRWFLTMESHLFKFRVDTVMATAGAAALKSIMKKHHAHLQQVSSQEKDQLRDQLLSVPPGMSPAEFASTTYYAIPFGQALELVAHRSCLVKNGIAYVPLPKIISTLSAKFRSNLSRSLALASVELGKVLAESRRIGPLLKTMNSQYASKERYTDSPSGVELTAATVDVYAKQSMPLCMSQLHAGLVRDSKLKHWGRLQYGLFLKGAGMTMEDSLLFFQSIFTKIMSAEQFQKGYAYNIRHMYGKEGKRASYTPYNCTKIILGQAPSNGGEHHGCPYRHYDDNHLTALLQKLQIGTAQDRAAIMAEKRAHNYQLACLKHYQAVHPKEQQAGQQPNNNNNMDGVGNHPNAWFAASVQYHANKKKKQTEGAAEKTASGSAVVKK